MFTLRRLFTLMVLTAAPLAAQETVSVNDAKSGALLLRTATPGRFVPALSVSSEVNFRITGPIVRASVKQRFLNSSGVCADGIYVFPLPDGAAVDEMFMAIGGRRIEGVIREREEARHEYEKARAQGRQASLLEQLRPNLFTVSVANMLPDDDVSVEIGYQEIARFEDGAFRLRFPTVVGMRYSPIRREGATVTSVDTEVPDTQGGGANEWQLHATIEAGIQLDSVTSSHHRIAATQETSERWRVRLDEGASPADRDFELVWRPRAGTAPAATLFTETIDGATYGFLLIVPPSTPPASRLPRDVIFVIDTSGSMEGDSMEQARRALLLGLERLTPADRFNVIEFNSITRPLFDTVVTADSRALSSARKFVTGLVSNGGTEMLPALTAAFQQMKQQTGALQQIVFITDGQVTNEAEMFALIRKDINNTRLFTVGIGSAPNGHLMSGAARFGHGTFTYIGNSSEIVERMESLFARIESPAVSGMRISGLSDSASLAPRMLGDVYAGEPLLLTFKERAARLAPLKLEGFEGTGAWRVSLAATRPTVRSGVARLWARKEIEALADARVTSVDSKIEDDAMLQTALDHHLVSPQTSLVAVDVTPSSLGQGGCVSIPVPLNTPSGSPQLGQLPATATNASLLALFGIAMLALAAITRAL